MKHIWRKVSQRYQCRRCKRTVEVEDGSHRKLDDCSKPPSITVRPLSKTPEEEAKRLYPDDGEKRRAFHEGVTWQRRQYGEQRREIERLQAMVDIKTEIATLEKKNE